MPPSLALIVFVVVQLMPGWVVAALIPKLCGRLSLTARVATAVALSIVQLILVGLVLISIGLATPAAIVVVNVAITATLLVVARHQLRRDWAAAAAATRRYRPEWRSVVVIVIITAVAAITVWKAFQNLPAATSAWGYAADTAEILDAGGLPETNFQYGEEVPFAATKTAGFAWLGSLRAFTGIGFTRSVQMLPLALLFGAMVAAWAIIRSFAGRLAAAGGILLLFFEYPAHSMLVVKYSRLTVEGAGITLGLLALWAVIAADTEDLPELRWLAAVMLVLTGLTHGVSAVMAVVFVASYQLARILLRQMSWRQIYRNAFVLGVVPGVGMLVGARLWSRASGFALSGGGYELVNGVGDPTLALRRVLNGRSIFSAAPPRSGVKVGHLFDDYFESMFSERSPLADVARQTPLIILLGVVVLIVLTWLGGNRQIAVTATLVLLAIFLIGVVFAFRYDIHVFRTHPRRREFPYGGLAVIGLAVAAVTGRRWRVPKAKQGLAVALVAALAATTIAVGWARSQRRWTGGGMNAAELEALDWVREQTPADSWILTNVRSTATFSGYAERHSLTEGDTPYTYPARLTTTLALLDTAQHWFVEPDLVFLEEHGIDYVVAARRRRNALGGDIYAPMSSLAVLDDQLFLEREAQFKHVVIYSVQP
jgi:hypothetical protein